MRLSSDRRHNDGRGWRVVLSKFIGCWAYASVFGINFALQGTSAFLRRFVACEKSFNYTITSRHDKSFSSPLSLKTSLQMIHSILRNIYAGRSLTPTELWTVRNSTNAACSTMVDTIVCPSPLVLSPVSSISFPYKLSSRLCCC